MHPFLLIDQPEVQVCGDKVWVHFECPLQLLYRLIVATHEIKGLPQEGIYYE